MLGRDFAAREVRRRRSPFLVRMNPHVRHSLSLFGEPDHVHRRRISRRPARSAFQRSLKLPDRRVPRPADVFEWNAGLGVTPAAFDLQPGQAAVQALADRRRRLRGAAVALHPDRPGFSLGAIGLTDGLRSALPCALGTDLGTRYLGAENNLARFGAHDWALQRPLRARAMPLGLGA